jgi:hypothetical protein
VEEGLLEAIKKERKKNPKGKRGKGPSEVEAWNPSRG